MASEYYWDAVRQNIADIRIWLAEVEARLPAKGAAPTTTVDDDVAAADSATRVQKALEREFGVDRRTILQRATTLVEGMQMNRGVPDWTVDVAFWKRLAERDSSGKTRLERGLKHLEQKREVAA